MRSTASCSLSLHSAAFACIADPYSFLVRISPPSDLSFKFNAISLGVFQASLSQQNLVSKCCTLSPYTHLTPRPSSRESPFLPNPSSLFVNPNPPYRYAHASCEPSTHRHYRHTLHQWYQRLQDRRGPVCDSACRWYKY